MIDIPQMLRSANPSARTVDLQVFADALRIYREASTNIALHGAIVFHPRTGAPIENPYLKIQTQKGAVLTKMANINSNRLVQALDDADT